MAVDIIAVFRQQPLLDRRDAGALTGSREFISPLQGAGTLVRGMFVGHHQHPKQKRIASLIFAANTVHASERSEAPGLSTAMAYLIEFLKGAHIVERLDSDCVDAAAARDHAVEQIASDPRFRSVTGLRVRAESGAILARWPDA